MAKLRICPHCGTANDNRATFCGACATQMVSTSTAIVRTPEKSALPVLSQREKATLGGVALGVAAVAIRVGAAIIRQVASQPAPVTPVPAPRAPVGDTTAMLIRRRWVVGDASGPTRWGEEEIEVEQPADRHGTVRVWLRGKD